jgi:hypothetical protein
MPSDIRVSVAHIRTHSFLHARYALYKRPYISIQKSHRCRFIHESGDLVCLAGSHGAFWEHLLEVVGAHCAIATVTVETPYTFCRGFLTGIEVLGFGFTTWQWTII